ncbi:FAD-dependent oxidoreductase [Streptomyces sp. NPDC048483]|uniref:FAD-dependent oxidoreductase n=1 Tax=Streptomyces sp. NPDC048483 TaxID=3154927 RepID=UPI0034488212
MSGTRDRQFDVVVVGGGPGGSTTATLIAQAGHRVLLLEKERFPRYQIGESLLPSTVHGIGAMLGVTKELEEANFPVKRGGTFRWGTNPEPWTFTFALSRKLAGPTSTAYQVDRARFDDILLKNARRHGVEVREEHEVLALEEEGGRVCGVRFRDADGAEHTVRSSYVVVAAGNTDSLYKTVATRELSDFFRNVALFGYYEGGKRLPAPNEGNILCAAFSDGWIWYIPLSDTLTSVGVVMSRDRIDVLQRGREEAMEQFIASCPLIADYLSDAHRVTEGMYGKLRVRKDYSYCNTSFWRPGVALVGDAACFIDPVFSTGVHLATYSGVLAARSINTRLKGELTEEACFTEFERRYRREYELFNQFLQSMYELNRDESSYFWEARKLLGTEQGDAQAFVDLVAGVSGPDRELFDSASRHPSNQFSDALQQASRPEVMDEGDLVFQGSDTRLLGDVLHEATDLQVRAALADTPELLPEPDPQFPGGLVPSRDGLHWRSQATAVSTADSAAGQ